RTDDERIKIVFSEEIGALRLRLLRRQRARNGFLGSVALGRRYRGDDVLALGLADLEDDLEFLLGLIAERVEDNLLIVVLEPLLAPLARRAEEDSLSVDSLAVDRTQPHLEVVWLDPAFQRAEGRLPEPVHATHPPVRDVGQ